MSAQFSLFAPAAPTIEGIDVKKAFDSYSADTIAERGGVRKPVSCCGDLWVSTGSDGTRHGVNTVKLYRLAPLHEFDGEPTTYGVKISIVQDGDRFAGDYARNDPNGFYHGMAVTHGGAKYVLVGPPQVLTAQRPAADNGLFAADDEDDEELTNEDTLPCVVCGDELAQSDSYEELEDGPTCTECIQFHEAVRAASQPAA